MTGDDTTEPQVDENEEAARTFTSPPVEFTAETEMAVWGINWTADSDQSFAYRVLRATPVRALTNQGRSPEEYAVREVAAAYGLPDFVFYPKVERSGKRTRERGGDGVILCGRRGIILSSKARKKPTSDDFKEIDWLRDELNTAYRQAGGSYRAMVTGPQPPALENYRGRSLSIDDPVDIDWTIVIVVDHQRVPATFVLSLPVINSRPPVVVVTRRDWDFLYRRLYSNYAVADYFRRVRAGQGPLGEEPIRYGKYALHDQGPGIAEIRELEEGRTFLSLPRDDVEPSDLPAHLVLRAIMEQVATVQLGSEVGEAERLSLLTALDAIPVVYRTVLGKQLLSELADARERTIPEPIMCTRVRGVVDGRPFAVFFGVASNQSESLDLALVASAANCQVELTSIHERTDVLTVGIVLIPETSSTSEWATLLKFCDGRPPS